MDVRTKLVHAATEYDRKQASKRSYNRYALGIYLNAIDATCKDIEQGLTVRAALLVNFNDRLLDAMLKSVGETKFTEEERVVADRAYFSNVGL